MFTKFEIEQEVTYLKKELNAVDRGSAACDLRPENFVAFDDKPINFISK